MERDVPLSKSTCNLLARLPRTGERVFPVNPDTVTAYFGKACVTLGIRDLRIHDLRRAAITELAKVASDALELSAFTGHKDLKSLKIYYNPSIKYLVGKLD
jgi:integrase